MAAHFTTAQTCATQALLEEIDRLNQRLAAVTADRDRLRREKTSLVRRAREGAR